MADQGPRRGLRVAKVLGVPVILTPSWLLFAVYIVLLYQPIVRDRVGDGQAYLVGALVAVLLLASVLLHELGHCVVARAFGLPVRSITISMIGGLTEITEPPQTPAREYAVAISGPMVSLLLTGAGVAAAGAFADGSIAREQCVTVAIINGAIAALNLLPGLPLDGGRVLRSIVWHFDGDPERATRAAARAGMVIAVVVVPLVLIGLLPAVGVGTRGVTTVVLSSLLAAFIYAQAAALLRRSQVTSRLPAVSVRALARPALAVVATMPLSEAVRQAHEQELRALVVVDGNGRFEGLVSEAWVRELPAERRPWVVVADGARRVVPGLVLDAGLSGAELLAAMRATPASEYLVAGSPPRVLVSGDVAAAMQS